MSEPANTYLRFNLAQRLEHWVMSLSFTILVITGLPQRYPLADWAEWMMSTMGGIEQVRIIHRVAATVFMAVMIYHFIVTLYKLYVLRTPLTMLPGLQDALDMLNSLRYQLGLIDHHPKLPRYTFAEKMEYWAVIWGGVIMAVTGFMLWNPIATTRFLPGEYVPAAKAAHSAEALLAFLAILIWHFYFVHLKTFNKAMFTGQLTHQQMIHEHAAELEQIEAGRIPPPPPVEVQRRRERIFLPAASAMTLVGLFGLYQFVTLEQTAIKTMPTASTVVAFVPATPTATATPLPTPTRTPTPIGGENEPVNASRITHPLGGREDCLECHAADAPIPYPANHTVYPNPACTVCHSVEGDNPPPPQLKHKLKGRDNCLKCHELDTLPQSHEAGEFTNELCLNCHPPRETPASDGSGGSDDLDASSEDEAKPTKEPKPTRTPTPFVDEE